MVKGAYTNAPGLAGDGVRRVQHALTDRAPYLLSVTGCVPGACLLYPRVSIVVLRLSFPSPPQTVCSAGGLVLSSQVGWPAGRVPVPERGEYGLRGSRSRPSKQQCPKSRNAPSRQRAHTVGGLDLGGESRGQARGLDARQ